MIKTNKEHVRVKTSSVGERNYVINSLLNEGYLWHGQSGHSSDSVERMYPFYRWPIVVIYKNKRQVAGSSEFFCDTTTAGISFESFKAYCEKATHDKI